MSAHQIQQYKIILAMQ